MKDYHDTLHRLIKSLFTKDELKIEIKMVEDTNGKIDHQASVGIRITHLPSGKEIICEEFNSQVQNANIALLKLTKILFRKAHK